MTRLTPEQQRSLRQDFDARARKGDLLVADAIREMRRILMMTQAEFGQAFRLTVRRISELENGRANPTVETLERLGRPFGMSVGFVPRKAEPARVQPVRTPGSGPQTETLP